MGVSAHYEIDWAAVEASTTDCQTLEQAIGRAVVSPIRCLGECLTGIQCADLWPSYDANDPFFAFSVADVAPDFGDEVATKEGGQKTRGIPPEPESVAAST